MSETQAQLEAERAAIKAAMAKPEFTQFADRSSRQRSLSDLQSRLDRVDNKLAQFAARPRQFFGVASKGLGQRCS